MADLREVVARASSDAQAYRAALSLLFTATINDADPALVARLREVEALVRQRESLPEDTARLLEGEGIGTTMVAHEAGIGKSLVSRLRHGNRIGHAQTVLVHDAAMRIVAARNQGRGGNNE